ncbi:MAG: methionine aminotransferase [Sphingomonadales bacterium]
MDSKLPHVGTTIFTTMSAMAQEYNAINLAQGFPNFEIDTQLQKALIDAAHSNSHQYAPMAGLISLREQIAALIDRQYQRKIGIHEILITAGATQAIFTAIQALVHSGEEVIILDPSYDCYEAPVLLCGAQPVRIPLNFSFKPNWELISAHVNSQTKLLIINNPHNPSGTTWEEADFIALEELMVAHPQLLLLSDEVYEFIAFEKHQSIHQRAALRNRAIIVSSFGKTFHVTGWKLGYLICHPDLMNEIHKVHQFLVFSVNSVTQVALANYLTQVDVNELKTFYREKRDFFRAQLASSRFELFPAQGSYFQLASYAQISDESDTDFCIRLTKEHGVAAIPLSVFNANGDDRKLIRFCYAKTNETLQSALDRLCKI